MIKKIVGHRIEKKNKKTNNDGVVRISYVASTDDIDRYGDVVSQNWDLKGFMANPVILWNHDQQAPPIARATKVDVNSGKLLIDVEFDMEDPHAANIARKAQSGFINAVSVGFQPIEMIPRSELPKDHKAYGSEGVFYNRSELLELSIVTVPANSRATQAIAAKSLSFDDLETIFKKRSRLETINRHIMQVKETEDSYLVEFAKAIHDMGNDSDQHMQQENDIGWGSGGDAAQEMNFDWLESYHDNDEDSEEDKKEKSVSEKVLDTAPKNESHNPENQDMQEIMKAILGEDNDYERLKMAHAYVQKGDETELSNYQLMIARMRNDELPEDAAPDEGKLVVYFDLVQSAMRELMNDDLDIPNRDKKALMDLLSEYYQKFDEPLPEMDIEEIESSYHDDDMEEEDKYKDDDDEKEKQLTIALIRALTQNGA